MDISKINKTIEKYQQECDVIAEKLERARQALIDDPTDEGQLKVIRNLESELTDRQALLQASQVALTKQQEADLQAQEKAMVEECKRLRSEADGHVKNAWKVLNELIQATDAILENVRKVESLAGSNHRELHFGDASDYRTMVLLRKEIDKWKQGHDAEAGYAEMIRKGLWK